VRMVATVVAVNRGPATTVWVPLQALPLDAAQWQDTTGQRVNATAKTLRLALAARASLCLVSL
jgi:hypothetical protein